MISRRIMLLIYFLINLINIVGIILLAFYNSDPSKYDLSLARGGMSCIIMTSLIVMGLTVFTILDSNDD